MRFAPAYVALPVVLALPRAANAPHTVAQGHPHPVPIASASVNHDGRFVAFESREQLSPTDTNPNTDIYVLRTDSGALELVSGTDGGVAGIVHASMPRLSGDGRYVVFEATVLTGRGPVTTVLLRDREAGTTRAVVVARNSPNEVEYAASPAISSDGEWVAFESRAPDLVGPIGSDRVRSDVYVASTRTGNVERISGADQGTRSVPGNSYGPSVSATGRFVAFTSTACFDREPTMAPPQPMSVPCQPQVYLRDRVAGQTRGIKTARDGWPNGSTYSPAVSADGRYVAFVSTATNLAPADGNGRADVYLYDVASGSIELISRTPHGRGGNGASCRPAISATGRFVSFDSTASDLMCVRRCARQDQDHNLVSDVFLLDREGGQLRRLSADATGDPWWEPSIAPSLDATARVVAFSSRHAMDLPDVRADFDLFVSVRRE